MHRLANFYVQDPAPRVTLPVGSVYIEALSLTPTQVLGGSRHRHDPRAEDAVQVLFVWAWHSGAVLPADGRKACSVLRKWLNHKMWSLHRASARQRVTTMPKYELPETETLVRRASSADSMMTHADAVTMIQKNLHLAKHPEVWAGLLAGEITFMETAAIMGVASVSSIQTQRDRYLNAMRLHGPKIVTPAQSTHPAHGVYRAKSVDRSAFVTAYLGCEGHPQRIADTTGLSLRTVHTKLQSYDLPRAQRFQTWTPEQRFQAVEIVRQREG